LRGFLPNTLDNVVLGFRDQHRGRIALAFCAGSAALPGEQCARAPRPKLVCRSWFDLTVLRDPHAAAGQNARLCRFRPRGFSAGSLGRTLRRKSRIRGPNGMITNGHQLAPPMHGPCDPARDNLLVGTVVSCKTLRPRPTLLAIADDVVEQRRLLRCSSQELAHCDRCRDDS